MDGWVHDSLREAIDLLGRNGRADLASDLNRVLEHSDLDQTSIMRSAEAEALLDVLCEADTLPELNDALIRMRDILGVDHCTFHIIKEGTSNFFRTQVVTTYQEDWVQRYVNAGFQSIDPVLHYSQAKTEGFYWDYLDRTSPVVDRFFSEAAKFGIGPSGYTSIVATESGDQFGLSVTSTKDAQSFRMHLDQHLPDMTVLSSFMAEAFVSVFSDSQRIEIQPTDEHLRVLRGIAEGMTWEELETIETDHGSFQNLSRSICETFGAKTVVQAAVYAARLGFLDTAPFTAGNIFSAASRNKDGEVVRADNVTSIRRRARARQSQRPEPKVVSLSNASSHR